MPRPAGNGGRTGGFSRFLAAACGLLLLAAGAAGALAQGESVEDYPDVLDARVTTTPERARLIVDLTGATQFAIVSLGEPNRIAVDVKAFDVRIAAPADVAGEGLVAAFSIGLAEKGRARTMLTLAAPAQVQQAYVLDAVADQPARLVVDLVPDSAQAFAQRVAASLAASLAVQGATPTAEAAVPPELGLPPGSRPLVVIDPGHGGADNGASAPNGVHEKDITLAFALDLQKLLVASGRYDVALTREDDSYLSLDDRVALARANKADLFISLHADSFQEPEIRGASVYTRDENATDVLDKVLADNENKYDIVAGFALPQATPAVLDILVDLMRREMRKAAFVAAQALVDELEPNVTLRRFPVRQADFFVLQAPDVPSILVELGFLSNAADIANLQKSDWRDKVVGSLARGIARYFEGAQQTAAVSP